MTDAEYRALSDAERKAHAENEAQTCRWIKWSFFAFIVLCWIVVIFHL